MHRTQSPVSLEKLAQLMAYSLAQVDGQAGEADELLQRRGADPDTAPPLSPPERAL